MNSRPDNCRPGANSYPSSSPTFAPSRTSACGRTRAFPKSPNFQMLREFISMNYLICRRLTRLLNAQKQRRRLMLIFTLFSALVFGRITPLLHVVQTFLNEPALYEAITDLPVNLDFLTTIISIATHPAFSTIQGK